MDLLSSCVLLQVSSFICAPVAGSAISTVTANSPAYSNSNKSRSNVSPGGVYLQTEVLPSEEYYEYLDIVPRNMTGAQPGVVPDPGLQDSPAGDPRPLPEEGEEGEGLLPDDSLADTDLHDHDLIDSVMYIYFGAASRDEGGAGRQVLAAGAVATLLAQAMALAAASRRVRACPKDPAAFVFLNTELALCSGNLAFLLGFQATANREWCEAISLLLHYLHLVACCWMLAISELAYRRLRGEQDRNPHLRCAVAWLLPAAFVLMCYVSNPASYETRRYCWMSVQRGMLLSYMVPVTMLIVADTAVTVLGLRLAGRQDVSRRAARAAAGLEPAFAVTWFLAVLAVENPSALALPLLAAASGATFNWFLYLRASVLLPAGDGDRSPLQEAKESCLLGTDSQPLLGADGCPPLPPEKTSSQVLEVRPDAISTITS